MSLALSEILLPTTTTGKVIGDFTIDYCKRMSDGAAVSTVGVTLVELGLGAYVVGNPNILENTAFYMHLTSDATIYAYGYWDLSEGNTALQTAVAAIPTAPLLAADARIPATIIATSAEVAKAASALDSAVWTSTKAGYIDVAVSSRSTYAGGAVASVTTPVTVGTNSDKTGYSLDATYDAAKTAATQSSVNAIPTTPLLTSDTRLNNLDATISSRSTFAGGVVSSVTNPVTVGTNNDKTGYSLTVTPPTVADIEASTILAKEATLVSGFAAGAKAATALDKTTWTDARAANLDFLDASISGLGTPMQTGNVTVGTNLDKTGYSLTQTFPSNFSSLAITGAGIVTVADPLLANVPGSYTSGTAGYVLGHPEQVEVSVLPHTGAVAYAGPVATGTTINMFFGDTPAIPYAVISNRTAYDLTASIVTMAIKKYPLDGDYVISPIDITSDVNSPATLGTGTIYITEADAALLVPGTYALDLVATKIGSHFTVLRLTLNVMEAVIH